MAKKVAVIGAGNVGATCAYFVAKSNIADVTLVDVVEGMPQAKADDFSHTAPSTGFARTVAGTNDYAEIAGADVVVHTAGIPRKPGMDRMDLLKTNVGIAQTAGKNIAHYAPNAVVIAVANPLDIISMVLLRETQFPSRRVVGMAGILDSTRFQYFIAEKLGVLPADVQAMVLGGHGDSMVPLPSYTSVAGVPVKELLDKATIEQLIERTRKGGGEIVSYLKTGSAFYAPAASAARMAEAVVTGRKRYCPASAYLDGEFGYQGIYLGVPIVLGSGGVERIIELPLSQQEKADLDTSAEHVRDGVKTLDSIDTSG